MAHSYRGQGLGRAMLDIAEAVAWRAGMRKVMLTVFLQNRSARTMYARCGYTLDVTSPLQESSTRESDSEDVHYAILSKVSPLFS